MFVFFLGGGEDEIDFLLRRHPGDPLPRKDVLAEFLGVEVFRRTLIQLLDLVVLVDINIPCKRDQPRESPERIIRGFVAV